MIGGRNADRIAAAAPLAGTLALALSLSLALRLGFCLLLLLLRRIELLVLVDNDLTKLRESLFNFSAIGIGNGKKLH